MRPSSLLIAYDAENSADRRFVDRLQQRDHWGLIIPFPIQNPELVRMAPELAGCALQAGLLGLDTATRRVFVGDEVLPQACRRLRGGVWLSLLARIPWLGSRILGFGSLARTHALTRR